MMVEGSGSGSRAGYGSGSIPLTSGSGSGRLKDMWIRWIWIRIRIQNTGLNLITASFPLTTASFTIKVVYDHTRIASYRHWGARSAGQLCVGLLALDGRNVELAVGFVK